MLLFPVVVILEALTGDEYDASSMPISFFRELTLPFTPSVGISIFQDGWFCGPLEQVEWHETVQGFICRVAVDDALVRKYSSERDRPTENEYIEWHIKDGWKRLGRGYSYPKLLTNHEQA